MVDETGDLKKGTATVGVQRQYTGTAGRIENAQVAVYLVYAGRAGHAVIDRELYLPQGWIDDPDRRRAAGVPDQVGFATKPELAKAMVCRALDAGVPAAWVTGDEVYGANPGLRAELEAREIGYVLAVACDHPVRSGGTTTHRADALLARVPARAWQQVSCGKGAKGHRLSDWAFICLDHHGPAPGGQACQHWLMIRRNQRTRRVGLLPLLDAPPGPAFNAGPGRRDQVDGGGAISDRQGPGRPGPAPGPPLALLVPVGHPCHARAGRSGDAAIKPAPVPATTDDKPPPGSHEDHDLRLEY